MSKDTPNIKNEITPKERKGIDMVVKGIVKRYPFVTGWEPIINYRDWEGVLFVNLIVNPFKLSEYFNCPLTNMWNITFKNNPQDYNGQRFYSLRSYLLDSCLQYDDAFKVKMKMEESFQNLYEHLPEQYSKFYIHQNSEVIKGYRYKEKPFISEYTLDLSDIVSVDNLS